MFTKCFYGVGLPCNTQVKLHEVAMESFRNPKKKLAVIICSEMCNCSETVRNSCKVFIGFSDLISGLVEYNMPGFKPRFLHGASAATWDRLRGNAALRRSFQAFQDLKLHKKPHHLLTRTIQNNDTISCFLGFVTLPCHFWHFWHWLASDVQLFFSGLRVHALAPCWISTGHQPSEAPTLWKSLLAAPWEYHCSTVSLQFNTVISVLWHAVTCCSSFLPGLRDRRIPFTKRPARPYLNVIISSSARKNGGTCIFCSPGLHWEPGQS